VEEMDMESDMCDGDIYKLNLGNALNQHPSSPGAGFAAKDSPVAEGRGWTPPEKFRMSVKGEKE
jgi:hypothetical protein